VEEVIDIFEEFDMTALVGGDGDTLGIFLDGTVYDLSSSAVMAEVDDFYPLGLHDTAHNINSGIMAIKKGSSRYDTDFMSHFALVFTMAATWKPWV
jgi:predicted heme/steroid binding protein